MAAFLRYRAEKIFLAAFLSVLAENARRGWRHGKNLRFLGGYCRIDGVGANAYNRRKNGAVAADRMPRISYA